MEGSVAIQVLPQVQSEEEIVRIVDDVIAFIKGTGCVYQVGPFETTIEGEYDELMEIVKQCQLIAIQAGAPAVSAYVKIAYKPGDHVLSIEQKTKKHEH